MRKVTLNNQQITKLRKYLEKELKKYDGNDYVKGKIVRHVTSTNDLCLIFKEAYKCKDLMKVMGTEARKVVIGEKEYDFKNTNRLIRHDSEYFNEYCLGGKTGTTSLAGYCLTTIAKKDDDLYVISICCSKDRYKDAKIIYDVLFGEE